MSNTTQAPPQAAGGTDLDERKRGGGSNGSARARPVVEARELLIVDPDPRRRQLLALGMERAGFAVAAVSAPAEVEALASAGLARLVLASAPLAANGAGGGGADLEAARLVNLLRRGARPEDPRQVVLLGEPNRRREAMEAGALAFVPRPAYLRDVVTLMRLLAARDPSNGSSGEHARTSAGGPSVGAPVEVPVSAPGGMCGDLEDWGAYFLARALNAAERSAEMVLERSTRRGRRLGAMLFSEGGLVDARVGVQRGAKAFMLLLLWQSGRVAVEFDDEKDGVAGVRAASGRRVAWAWAGPARPTRRSTHELIDEGRRFADNFHTVVARVGGLAALFRHDPGRVAPVRRKIPPEVRAFLPRFDGSCTLQEIVEEAPFSPFDTVLITHRLLDLGVLERCPDEPAEAAEARLRESPYLLQPLPVAARRPVEPPPEPAPKAETKAGPKVEPTATAKVEPKAEPEVESKAEARVEAKTEAKVESKAEARVEAKTEAKVESKATTTVAKPDPKLESKREAKAEAQAAPKVEAKVAPLAEAMGAAVEPVRAERTEVHARPRTTRPPSPGPDDEQRADMRADAEATVARRVVRAARSGARAFGTALADDITARVPLVSIDEAGERSPERPVERRLADFTGRNRAQSHPSIGTPVGPPPSLREGPDERCSRPLREGPDERRSRPPAAPGPARPTGPHPSGKVGFDRVDEEFFAREAELHEVEEFDSFDDLGDDLVESSRLDLFDWFPFGRKRSGEPTEHGKGGVKPSKRGSRLLKR